MRRVKRSSKKSPAVKAAELAIAAPQVVAIRTARMLAAGARPGAADRAEFSRMGSEKTQAFWESMLAMGTHVVRAQQEYSRTAALQWWRLWTTTPLLAARPLFQAVTALPRAAASIVVPTRGQSQRAVSKLVDAALTPVHKRATANARRLGRVKKRSRQR